MRCDFRDSFLARTLASLCLGREPKATIATSQTILRSRSLKRSAKIHYLWWKVHEAQFSYVRFVACQILGIVGFQIEAKQKSSTLQVFAQTFDNLN
jgi:hypothetical protein